MRGPTISQYTESVTHPEGKFRRVVGVVCETDAYGKPVFTSGGSGVVFKVRIAGRTAALKCFSGFGRSNVKELYTSISAETTPLLYRCEWLPQELYVFDECGRGGWHDILISEWAEGSTLEYEIRRALHYRDGARLLDLAEAFEEMALQLLGMPWSHGDLKPSNIMVEKHTGLMRLLDYESMVVPGLANDAATISSYGCPKMDLHRDGLYADEYPIAMIMCTLRSLARDPALYAKYGTSDYFLFSPEELFSGSVCKAWEEAKTAAAREGDARVYTLLEMLAKPSAHLENLKEIILFLPGGSDTGDPAPEPFVKAGKWGYRSGGKTLIPAIYDNALEFREGFGVVETGGFRHYINNKGEVVINGSEYETLKSFYDGHGEVRKSGVWYRIDRNGVLEKK